MYLREDPHAQKRKQFISLVTKRVQPGTGGRCIGVPHESKKRYKLIVNC